MLLAVERKPHAIVPVAVDPNAKPNGGAKGWLPLVLHGYVEVKDDGEGLVLYRPGNHAWCEMMQTYRIVAVPGVVGWRTSSLRSFSVMNNNAFP
ncbi:hypothetical protein [Stutzerimonas decontaminans]|nr:hypothetical protein [Stutzerimonas decontaminans]